MARKKTLKDYREHGFAIGSGAVESAHRHVLQVRMARLRAAYRTAGAIAFHPAISVATETRSASARYGQRDLDKARHAASM